MLRKIMEEPIELAGNLIVEDREILLIHRTDENHWEVPGGKVEADENPTEAAVREAEEEVGVEVELKKPFYSGEFQHDNDIFLWHCYLASTDEVPKIQEEKFDEMGWFLPGELDDLELAPNIVMILPALRRL